MLYRQTGPKLPVRMLKAHRMSVMSGRAQVNTRSESDGNKTLPTLQTAQPYLSTLFVCGRLFRSGFTHQIRKDPLHLPLSEVIRDSFCLVLLPDLSSS